MHKFLLIFDCNKTFMHKNLRHFTKECGFKPIIQFVYSFADSNVENSVENVKNSHCQGILDLLLEIFVKEFTLQTKFCIKKYDVYTFAYTPFNLKEKLQFIHYINTYR